MSHEAPGSPFSNPPQHFRQTALASAHHVARSEFTLGSEVLYYQWGMGQGVHASHRV